MANYYIYLPVNDLGLVAVAAKWVTDSKKDMEVIVRKSQGAKKTMARDRGGKLRNVTPTSTVYVLAHGFSAGREVTGAQAAARKVLSGLDYEGLQKRYPKACEEIEANGYANLKLGYNALVDALDDDDTYEEIVKIVAKYVTNTKGQLEISRPAAIAIGGTRPDGTTKTYTATAFYAVLRSEELPQVPRLKIFACNSGITPAQGTTSFAETLYESMKVDYPNTRVFGYLGAVSADYSTQKTFAGGNIPDNSSEIWKQFHKGDGKYEDKATKGVRMVEPSFKKIVEWGSSNQEFIPAHVLRVEFPGGQTVRGDMKMQEDDAKPW